VVLVLLGGTTWARDGFWAPDGGYAIVSGIILYLWVAVVSGFLVIRKPSTARAPSERRCPRRSSERRDEDTIQILPEVHGKTLRAVACA
jgi:hypothetical protein